MEASLGVLALSVALTGAWPSFKALILIDALMRAFIIGVSAFTVTPETAQEVHASPTLADVRHHLALIDLLEIAGQRVNNLTGSTTTTEGSVFCTALKRNLNIYLQNPRPYLDMQNIHCPMLPPWNNSI